MIDRLAYPSRLKANALLVLATLIWGVAFVAQSLVKEYGLAFLYNGATFTLGSLFLLPFVPRKSIPRNQWVWMLIAGFLLFAGSSLQQVGILYTRVANASFLTTLYVVFTPILLFIGFREKPGKLEGFAVFLAIVGAFLLSTGGEFHSESGDILEVMGAVFWAAHIVLLGKFAQRFESISFAAGQFLITGLLSFAVGAFFEPFGPLLIPKVVGSILFRGVLSIGIGYTLQVWAQKFTSPTDAGLIFALEAVFGAWAGWLLLSEKLLFPQIAGCLLILVSAILSQVKKP